MALPASDDELLLLHNPRCSKSRAALALLEASGLAFRVRDYQAEPLSRAELADLARRLGRPPAEWVRRSQAEYAEAGLGPDAKDTAILAAMAKNPILIERPILVRGVRAVVGRPPENVRDLF